MALLPLLVSRCPLGEARGGALFGAGGAGRRNQHCRERIVIVGIGSAAGLWTIEMMDW